MLVVFDLLYSISTLLYSTLPDLYSTPTRYLFYSTLRYLYFLLTIAHHPQIPVLKFRGCGEHTHRQPLHVYCILPTTTTASILASHRLLYLSFECYFFQIKMQIGSEHV